MSKHPAQSAFDAASPAGVDQLPPEAQTIEPSGQHPILAVQPRPRAAGWTTAKQVIFLETLSAAHDVKRAAKAAGMSRQSAYNLRARLKGEPFDLAWEAALHCPPGALVRAAARGAGYGAPVCKVSSVKI